MLKLLFLVALIFIAILLGVYLIIFKFGRLKKHYERFYKHQLRQLEESFRSFKDEDDKVSLLNRQLAGRISKIANLYEITKEMSATLFCLDIFEILAKFLRKAFSFKRCSLILLDPKKPENIDKIYRVAGIRDKAKILYVTKTDVQSVEPDGIDENLVLKMAGGREVIKVSSFSRVLDQKKRYLSGGVQSFLATPIIVDEELTGILCIENLSSDEFDNFLILSRQFALEIRKARLYETVQELAITDGLTGAYVRRHFLERLEEELERSKKHEFNFSFLMLDIDHFKRCNDTYGHLVGDAVLHKIVNIVKTNVRQIDLVGRYGGEEFSILLPETGKEDAVLVAERIREAVRQDRFKVYDEFTSISVSIGVAVFPDDSEDGGELIDKADKALYRAKSEGRNRVCTF